MADRIPPELFETIVRSLPEAVNIHDKWESRKRLLGRCSLTCRYWATHIRPFIFGSLTLRSRDDMQGFLAFVSCTEPTVKIRLYVRTLFLLQAVPSDPWIHFLLNFTPKSALPNLVSITLISSGNTTPDEELERAVGRTLYYQNLPNALPAAHIWRFDRHSIIGVHFRAFKELLPLIASLDSARTDCTGLTWSEDGLLSPVDAPESTRTARRWAGEDKLIRIQGCTAVWPFVWCLVTTRRPARADRKRPVFVERTFLPVVLHMIQCITDQCTCSRCDVLGAKQLLFYRIGKHYDNPVGNTASISITINKGEFEVHALMLQVQESGSISHIRFIVNLEQIITSFSSKREDIAATLDWSSLDEYATALGTAMTSFSIDVQVADVTKMQRFVNTVTMRMAQMTSTNRLTFRRRPGITDKEDYAPWVSKRADGDGHHEPEEEEVPDWYLKW